MISRAYDEIKGFSVSKDDDLPRKLNRLSILKRACNIGLEKCLTETMEELLDKYLKPKEFEAIKPDLQAILYCGGVRNSAGDVSKTLYEKLLERYAKIDTSVEKQNLVRGLGCFSDKDILNK